MCSSPVSPSAFPASQKTLVLFVNIIRHKVSYVWFGNRGEGRIADRAPREGAGHRRNVKGCEYLIELLSDVITFYEDMVGGERPGNEPGITGEDHAVLLQRDANELVIGHGPVVEDIESQEPHPLRETTEHDISDEFHIYSPRRQFRTQSTTKARSHEELRTINKKIKKMGTFSHHEGTKSRRTKSEL